MDLTCVRFRAVNQERNGPSGSAGTPAATAHWDDSERTRSLARSCSRARSSAASLAPSAVGATGIANERPGGRIGRAVERLAADRAVVVVGHRATQRASSRCPRQRAVARQVARFGRTASPETARRKTHWGWMHTLYKSCMTLIRVRLRRITGLRARTVVRGA